MTSGALLFPLDPEHVGPVEELAQPFVGAFSNGFSDRAGENDSALTHEREADGAPVFLKLQVIEGRGGLGFLLRQKLKQSKSKLSRVRLGQVARKDFRATGVELDLDCATTFHRADQLGDEERRLILVRHIAPRLLCDRTETQKFHARNLRRDKGRIYPHLFRLAYTQNGSRP